MVTSQLARNLSLTTRLIVVGTFFYLNSVGVFASEVHVWVEPQSFKFALRSYERLTYKRYPFLIRWGKQKIQITIDRNNALGSIKVMDKHRGRGLAKNGVAVIKRISSLFASGVLLMTPFPVWAKDPEKDTRGNLANKSYDFRVSQSGKEKGNPEFVMEYKFRPRIGDITLELKGKLIRTIIKSGDQFGLNHTLRLFDSGKRKQFFGTAFAFKKLPGKELDFIEGYLGLGGTLWNEKYSLPILGQTQIKDSIELWPGYFKEKDAMRFPILEQLSIDSKEVSLKYTLGYDPSIQQWIELFQGWRTLFDFGGPVLNFGVGVGTHSKGSHLFLSSPTDPVRLSLQLADRQWGILLDYTPSVKGWAIKFDFTPLFLFGFLFFSSLIFANPALSKEMPSPIPNISSPENIYETIQIPLKRPEIFDSNTLRSIEMFRSQS